jgi:CRP/FNR family cyclic AMP-dependent transcriptional regulator
MSAQVQPPVPVRKPFPESLFGAGFLFTVPAHAVLFSQGQEATGIHILKSGQVKVTTSSQRGRTFILKIAEPGEILGLHNCFSGEPYETTAEALQPCQLNFVRREHLLAVLAHDPEAQFAVTERMSRECHYAYEVIQSLASSNGVGERMARLLLELSTDAKPTPHGLRTMLGLTHEEIGQMIGASRETVTRVLKHFRMDKIAVLRGSTLLVLDRPALQAMVDVEVAAPPAAAAFRWPRGNGEAGAVRNGRHVQ